MTNIGGKCLLAYKKLLDSRSRKTLNLSSHLQLIKRNNNFVPWAYVSSQNE